jgi:transposase-like protein
MTEPKIVYCPYCGEENEIEIDLSAGKRQSYEEDCQVCCRPWKVNVKVDSEGDVIVNLKTEEEL